MPDFAATLHWTAAPLTIGIAAAPALYLRLRRHWLGRAGSIAAPGRPVVFASGLVLLAVALVGPLDWLGEQRLMSAHMLQHILLMSAVPVLLLAGWPRPGAGPVAGRGPAGDRPWARPALCLVGAIVAIWTLHAPIVLDTAVRNPWLNDLQHLLLLGAGGLLAWPLIGPGAMRGLPAVAYIAVAELAVGALGIWLTFYPELVYSWYAEVPRIWGLSAQTDQSVAGAMLLVLEEPFLAVEVAILFMGALDDDGASEDAP